jgi:hypothetical protein
MSTSARDSTPSHGVAWWLGWGLVTALVLGGVYLAVRHVNDTASVIDTRR